MHEGKLVDSGNSGRVFVFVLFGGVVQAKAHRPAVCSSMLKLHL